MENKTNVVPINRCNRGALFSDDLRQRLESGLHGKTENPEEAVNAVESIICTYGVFLARRAAENVGKWLANNFIKQAEKVVK
jgi:hypothetical protein